MLFRSNFFARHHQARIAPAKQRGEHLAEVLVDRLEGVPQQLTRFGIDFANGVFQRGHRLIEVAGLRVEEGFSFARRGQFIQRGEVDRAEALDLAVQTVDFTLQSRQTHRAFLDGCSHRIEVGLRLSQQLAVLLQA